MVKDNLSNYIVKLKNAGKAGLPTVSFPYSKFIAAVSDVLQKEGYLVSIERKGKKLAKFIEVALAYGPDKRAKIQGVERMSKPSRRLYGKAKHMHPIWNGTGRMIISTPKGIMTDSAARKQHVGGELLFKIW